MIDDDTRPVIVGERTNVLGSRKFKRLIGGAKFEEAAELGRLQVRRGAHVLDICVQDPDRDELADMSALLFTLVKKVKVPLMIDSTDANVIEESLKRTPGQVADQLDQPRGRRRALRARRADCTPLWRRTGGRLYR